MLGHSFWRILWLLLIVAVKARYIGRALDLRIREVSSMVRISSTANGSRTSADLRVLLVGMAWLLGFASEGQLLSASGLISCN
jgi:hypothetical protein